MKLIIDIPEEDRKDIGNIHFVREDLKFKIGKAIMNGTPLDDVKAEIKNEYYTEKEPSLYQAGTNFGLSLAVEILDNIGKDKGGE